MLSNDPEVKDNKNTNEGSVTQPKKDSVAEAPSLKPNADSSEGGGVNIRPKADESKEKSSIDKAVVFDKIKGYSIAMVSIAIAFLLFFFVLLPQVNVYKVTTAEILTRSDRLTKVTSYAEYLQSLKALSAQLDQNVAISEQAIPTTDEVPFLQNMLLQIAEDSTIDVQSLSLAGFVEPKANELGEVKTQVSLLGTYDNLLNYVKKLENSRRLIRVGDIRLTGGNEDTPDIYTLNLQTNAYYMPKPDLQNVSLDSNTVKPKLEPVLEKLVKMDEYELREINIEIGKTDLFSNEEAETPGSGTGTGTTGTGTTGTQSGSQATPPPNQPAE